MKMKMRNRMRMIMRIKILHKNFMGNDRDSIFNLHQHYIYLQNISCAFRKF